MLPPDDLDQHPLGAMAMELTIEDLFPVAEVELALGNCHDYFATHNLSLQVGAGLVLAGAVVVVRAGIEGSELFQPHAEIVVQAALVVIDEYGAGYVHRVNEARGFTTSDSPSDPSERPLQGV